MKRFVLLVVPVVAFLATGCPTSISDPTPDEAQACFDAQGALSGAATRLGCGPRPEVCPIAHVYSVDATLCIAERSMATSCAELDAAEHCTFSMPRTPR